MNEKERELQQKRLRRRKNELIMKCIISLAILLVLVCGFLLGRELIKGDMGNQVQKMVHDYQMQKDEELQIENGDTAGTAVQNEAEDGEAVEAVFEFTTEKPDEMLLLHDQSVAGRAALMAAQYNYDGAIELLKAEENYDINDGYQNMVAMYTQEKEECVPYPVDQITHVFFHTMIYDDDKAFDGDEDEAGYNQVMTTIPEFNSIIQQMYDRGYVMVSLHDMCEVHPDGTVTEKEIYLPSGKIPFVLSQDDVSYYHYMDGDGFAQKLIVDENGEIKNTYIEDDGSISVGDYDMVPLIDTFVKEHPDFAYHGHKGIIALTGYEGVLGYRTDEVYRTREEDRVTEYQQAFFDANPDFDWEKEVADARVVAEAMKEDGWEFASHTWGHINPLGYGYESTVDDTVRWQENVASVVGDTDVLIFAFGADIGDWQPYDDDNEFFRYYHGKGFRIFCNVDASTRYWVQFGDRFMRQGRRNLDGYRMYYSPELIEDLFDVKKAWDEKRPTPVPEM